MMDGVLPARGQSGLLRIVAPSYGTAIRTIVGAPRTVGSQGYVSIRNGRTLGTEGATEGRLALYGEVMPAWVKSRSQPMRVEHLTGTMIERSIVDWAFQGTDGIWTLVDAKRDWAGFRTSSGQRQTRLTRMAADELGANYMRVTYSSLGDDAFFANLDLIQTYRFLGVSLHQQMIAADLLAKHQTVSVGALADEISNDPASGFAAICSLMVRRVVSIGIASKVSRHSLVTAVPPLTVPLPDLFAPVRLSATDAA